MRARKFQLLAAALSCMVAPCAAGTLAPPWMRAFEEIVQLPDPLQPQAIRGIAGAPAFGPARCVLENNPRAPVQKCWAETGAAGPFARAVLEYARHRSGAGPALYGTLSVTLAPQQCSTVAQAERVFGRRFLGRLGPEPIAGPVDPRIRHYGARLFGAGMQPLSLHVKTVSGCITSAVLAR